MLNYREHLKKGTTFETVCLWNSREGKWQRQRADDWLTGAMMEQQENAEAAGISEGMKIWYPVACWCFYSCMFVELHWILFKSGNVIVLSYSPVNLI
jgi:hypothetical protein